LTEIQLELAETTGSADKSWSKHLPQIRYPSFIDVFAGCGGLSLGFAQAGFHPILGIEQRADSAETYRTNFGAPVYEGDVRAFIQELPAAGRLLHGVDLVIGGPPCQGFSPLGRMSRSAARTQEQRSQNQLWQPFLDVVQMVEPQAFVAENVPEFLRSRELQRFRSRAEKLGYKTLPGVLDAADFGVPQHRRRAFVIGSRSQTPSLPTACGCHSNVEDWIRDLPREPDGNNWHVGRNPRPKSLLRYAVIPPGGNRFDLVRERPDLAPRCWIEKTAGTTDVFGRLSWDKPASTIRTEFFKPEKGRYLHPEADRAITPREAACLQTFPMDFSFSGTRTGVARQIGEAVPPLLARAVAGHVLQMLGSKQNDKREGQT
jgi:DNA (cytosine-5)-methyltransferase 1